MAMKHSSRDNNYCTLYALSFSPPSASLMLILLRAPIFVTIQEPIRQFLLSVDALTITNHSHYASVLGLHCTFASVLIEIHS